MNGTETQEAIVTILSLVGPLTDEGIYRRLLAKGLRVSPSGARTRRAELVRRGDVYDTRKRLTMPSGRRAILWGAVADAAPL